MSYHCESCNHPADTRHGMAMHYLNSSNHPDVSDFSEAEQLADESKGSIGSDNQTDTQTNTSQDTGANSVSFPENPDKSEPDTDKPEQMTPTACPKCGSTEIKAGQTVAKTQASRLDREHILLLMDSDHCCLSCGGVWDE